MDQPPTLSHRLWFQSELEARTTGLPPECVEPSQTPVEFLRMLSSYTPAEYRAIDIVVSWSTLRGIPGFIARA